MKFVLPIVALLLAASAAELPPELAVAVQRNVVIRHFDDGDESSLASGVNIGGQIVLTNAHVIEKDVFIDDHTAPARVLAVNEREDLALLHDSRLPQFPFVTFETDVSITEEVCYVGNPGGLPGAVVCGRVSFMKPSWIYTDTNGGNGVSGGGLWNAAGHLVGVLRGANTDGNGHHIFSMAKPSHVILQFLKDVGLKIGPVKEESEGEQQ